MHLPDGILDIKTTLGTTGIAAVGLGVALRQVRATLPPRQMPMLGLAGAFIFAAQMLNFPVAGGTSGHLMGGPLAAVLLGPGPAVVVMTCVLIVQALMFSDGGLTALGANILNIGITAPVSAYLIFRLVKRLTPGPERRVIVFAAAFAAWVGTVLASVTCAGELAAAGSASWHAVLPALMSVHMLIGVGEGLATGLIVAAVAKARPELLAGSRSPAPARALLAYGLVVSLGLALFVAPFACPWPDGLEKVASEFGIAFPLQGHGLPAASPEYGLTVLSSGPITALAGALGTMLAFSTAYLLARLVVPGRAPQQHATPAK